MDFEQYDVAVKIVSTLIALGTLLFTIRNQVRRSRQAIKLDLEIYDLLEHHPKMQNVVWTDVHERLNRLYGQPRLGRETRIHNRGLFYSGLAILIISLGLTIYIDWDGFNAWSILTGFFALAGAGNMLNGLEKPPSHQPHESGAGESAYPQ